MDNSLFFLVVVIALALFAVVKLDENDSNRVKYQSGWHETEVERENERKKFGRNRRK